MPDPESSVVKLSLDMAEYNEMLDAAEYAVETGQMSEVDAQETLFAFIRIKQETEQPDSD